MTKMKYNKVRSTKLEVGSKLEEWNASELRSWRTRSQVTELKENSFNQNNFQLASNFVPLTSNFTIKLFSLLLILLSIFLLATLAYAIPNSLTLQGKLTNLAGASQQGTFNFSFRIYSIPNFTYYNVTFNDTTVNETGVLRNSTYINYTDILWEQNQSVTTDANGVYDVILTGINLSFADQYYLGITVEKDNESVPRINLTSAPYSFRANISEDLNANNSYFVTNLSIRGNATIGSGGTTLEVSTQTFNLTKNGNVFAAGNLSIDGNSLFVDSANNFVGIGIGNPQYLLQVALGTDGRSVNLSNVVYVNASSGRVGIGATSPSEVLTVIGNANISGYLNISGDLIVNKQFNVSSSGNVKIGGGLNVSGVTNISNNFYVVGNAVIGDATSDTIEVNAQVASDLIPNNNDRDLGSGANFWRRGYIDLLTVNNLSAAETNISGTTSPVFTINSNYSGNDDRDIELVFERGTPIINAVLKWDSTNKRFDMNFPLFIQANNNLTVDTNTLFVDGSINRVGIGTTTPTHTLTVVGDINATGAVFSAAVNITGNLNLLQGSLGVNTSSPAQTLTVQGTLNVSNPGTSGQLFVASSGNVGIGTTTPDNLLIILGNELTSNAILHINASDNFNKSVINVITLDHILKSPVNSTGGIGVSILFRATDNASQLENVGNISAILYNSTNGSELSAITFSTRQEDLTTGGGSLQERLRIDGRGRIGVNTTTPAQTLQVAGTLNVTANPTRSGDLFVASGGNVGVATTSPVDTLTVIGSVSTFGSLNATSINATTITVGSSLILPNSVNASMSLWNISGSNIYPRDSSGRVGINTSTPANTLTVQGTLNVTSQPTRSSDLFVASDGSVGIGTFIPAAKLHVNATTTATADFTNIKSGIVFNGEIAMTNWYGTYISAPAGTGTITNKYAFVTEANAGNVGINTTTPSSTFQVAGSANITSASTQFLVNSNGNVIINLKG